MSTGVLEAVPASDIDHTQLSLACHRFYKLIHVLTVFVTKIFLLRKTKKQKKKVET